ncbi:hypothetical protein G210_4456 [Candida maltosa Xu316]|uniref:C2H2-type domain-containing protein n=1 Tax=Candida maltosa (strain Xu316) TaxID=1245528 RepID=M3JSX6_CANMX|nr:hypothetical protein G210_4456 [Candida maltosa Xu316]
MKNGKFLQAIMSQEPTNSVPNYLLTVPENINGVIACEYPWCIKSSGSIDEHHQHVTCHFKGARPFVCLGCGTGFKDKSALKAHASKPKVSTCWVKKMLEIGLPTFRIEPDNSEVSFPLSSTEESRREYNLSLNHTQLQPKRFVCLQCWSAFSQRVNVISHVHSKACNGKANRRFLKYWNKDGKPKRYLCLKVATNFDSFYKFHSEEVDQYYHKPPSIKRDTYPWMCLGCGRCFTCYDKLLKHLNLGSSTRGFLCKVNSFPRPIQDGVHFSFRKTNLLKMILLSKEEIKAINVNLDKAM